MRYVMGLDPLVTGIHVAAFAETKKNPVAKPQVKLLHAPKLAEPKDPLAHVERMTAAVDELLESVAQNGLPELVVLMRPTVGLPAKDESGPRRMMVAGEIERRLVELKVPIAEVAPATLMKWVLGPTCIKRDVEKLAAKVVDIWKPVDALALPGYRLSTVAVAAVGAAVLGIPTAKASDPRADTELMQSVGLSMPRAMKLAALKRLTEEKKDAEKAAESTMDEGEVA